jgi:cytochrome c-type biogenesis protein CcmH
MQLWFIFSLLTIMAMAAVLWPLMRERRANTPRTAGDSAIYRDQLAEIDADLARGLIGESEAEAARTEISRRLLAVAESGKEKEPVSPDAAKGDGVSRPRVAALVAAIAIPVLSLGLYGVYGSPDQPDQPLAARLAKPDASEDIAALVGKVEARLRAHPEDGRGWDVIAPVYLRMRRYEDAADAYRRAIRLLGETTPRLVGYAESLVLADNGIVSENARLAFEKASERDGSLAKPRFWLGMAAEQDGRFEKAAEIWRGMLDQAPAGAPWKEMVTDRLAFAESKLGGAGEGTSGARLSTSSKPGPTEEDVAAAQQMTAEERGAMIRQMVSGLAQRLQKNGDDLQGWLRLVRAYSVLGERTKAEDALKSARQNFADDEKALAALSELAGSLGL